MTVLDAKRAAPGGRPTGVSGWLALFLAIVTLQGVLLAVGVPALFRYIGETATEALKAYPVIGPMLLGEAIYPFAFILAAAWGIWLTVKLRPSAPRYWGWLLLGVFAYGLADAVLARVLLRQVAGDLAGPDMHAFRNTMWNGVVEDLRSMLWAAIWTWYWKASVRVRLTFGRNTWTRAMAPADEVQAEPVPEAEPVA